MMPKHPYTVRFSDEENQLLEKRRVLLGYTRASALLRDAGLGRLSRDAGDGLPGWCHDVTQKLNMVLHDPESGHVRKDLLDVARRIERGLDLLRDQAEKPAGKT
jgi:hypothetical protein